MLRKSPVRTWSAETYTLASATAPEKAAAAEQEYNDYDH